MAALVECHYVAEVERALCAGATWSASIIAIWRASRCRFESARDLFAHDPGRGAARRGERNRIAERHRESPRGGRRCVPDRRRACCRRTIRARSCASSGGERPWLRRRSRSAGSRRPRTPGPARRSGVDYLGVIFADGPRRVTPERASEIRRAVPGVRAGRGLRRRVGRGDRAHRRPVRSGLIQLHGDESPTACADLRAADPAADRQGDPSGRVGRSGRAGGVSDGAGCFSSICTSPTRSARGGREALWRDAARAVDAGHRVLLAGGLDAGERLRGDHADRRLRHRCQSRSRAGAGSEGPGGGAAADRGGARMIETTRRGRFGPYGGQYVPETLMPLSAGAGGGVRRRAARSGIPARARLAARRRTPGGRRRSTSRRT